MSSRDASVTWRRMQFEEARIESVGEDFSSILVIEGVSPYANMRLEVNPFVYESRPDYWGIEVVGCLSKIAIPSITPFELVLVLDFPVGAKGIEIFGAENKSVKLDHVHVEKANPDSGSRVLILGERKDRIRNDETANGESSSKD